MTSGAKHQGILVFPHLRVQNANAISGPFTHGFPSITAFTGLTWALERKLAEAQVPLRLHGVGVICHKHQEQVTPSFVSQSNQEQVSLRAVRTFNLTRNPVDKDGSTAAIVEEGRMHLEITLVIGVSEKRQPNSEARLIDGNHAQIDDWATQAADILSQMRIAGGTLLPPRPMPGRRIRPWIGIVADDAQESARQFRQWRRQWLPGFALVGRDDVLAHRLEHLRQQAPDSTLLDAWMHASRFNHQVIPASDEHPSAPAPRDGKVRWDDPLRPKGSGWIVPIPVGYAALTPRQPAGSVLNARDMDTPVRFVESVYSLGQWISPHRLTHLQQLLWHAQTDESKGLYRCRNGYQPEPPSSADADHHTGAASEEDTYAYD